MRWTVHLSAALMLLGVAGGCAGEVPCTTAGCADVTSVTFAASAGTWDVELQWSASGATRCTVTGGLVSCDADGLVYGRTVSIPSTEAVRVIVRQGGAIRSDETIDASVVDFRPNGPACEPVCQQGQITVFLTGGAPPPDATALPDTTPADATMPDVAVGTAETDQGPGPVCIPNQRTCESLEAVQVCDGDGLSRSIEPCEDEQVCYLGECQPTVCETGDETWCDVAGRRRVCNGLGTAWTPIPCPGGSACEDGQCVPIRPNVVLIVDTSDSMNDLFAKLGSPTSCQGEDCPPWDFPDCDSPDTPWTRLGQVKKALTQLIGGEAPEVARLALQRFPQTPNHESGCDHGYWGSLSSISGHDEDAQVPPAVLAKSLHQIMIVPFPADEKGSDLAGIAQWTNFEEAVAPTDQSCDYDWDCPDDLCEGSPKRCQAMVEPELRAVGSTPLGLSLFYAGEYLRQMVLVEGRSCDEDADCGSPNHTCQQGACHDPHRECRAAAIILFTDGQETSYESTDQFFNPSVQARRLHWGLGCLGDASCSSGATCEGGLCTPPSAALPSDLPEMAYSPAVGNEAPLGPDGLPRSVLIHVVDASNGGQGAETNAAIAGWGGGKHVPVDLSDLDQLVTELVGLLDVKLPNTCGP